MNVLFITMDSLRRDVVGAYRETPRFADYKVATPNLDRFADRANVFDTHYAGSLACMPARREFLCGVREFLWRPWGSAEPFDETIPAVAGRKDIVTQQITDHYHYLEHGGRGYFEDFQGFEFVRGHEFDFWRTAPTGDSRLKRQTETNRDGRRERYARNVADLDEDVETDFFAPRVFSRLDEWLDANREHDQWLCYVDSFDVHEPFHCPEPYASMYTDEDPRDPGLPLWPPYDTVEGSGYSERELDFVRSQFAGKVTMVDEWFGRVLDRLDELGAWDDTIVVVTTDHGYSLGDHGWLAKNVGPVYQEIAHTPLMIHHPDAEGDGDRIDALTSAVDIYPTLLDGLGIDAPSHTHGESLLPLLRGETDHHRDMALYGYFGAGVNVTDGKYTYLHANPDPDVATNCYSTYQMPSGRAAEAKPAAKAAEIPHAETPVWRYPTDSWAQNEQSLLFDVEADPGQQRDLVDEATGEVERLRALLVKGMERLDAPEEQYDRLQLSEYLQ